MLFQPDDEVPLCHYVLTLAVQWKQQLGRLKNSGAWGLPPEIPAKLIPGTGLFKILLVILTCSQG